MARNNNDDNIHDGGTASFTMWWAAGGVIVLVIAGLLWILLSGGGSGSTATPTRTVTASPTVGVTGTATVPSASTSTGTTSTASRCNVPGGNTLVPTSAIPATWQAVGAVAAPVSSTAGPKTITGPGGTLRSCYQHSPTGAVIAAMNIALASSSPNGHAVIEQGYTPGPGKTEAEQLPADPSDASVAGFLTQACTQDACLVRIAITVQGQDIEGTMPMIWSGGDWKVNGQVTGVAKGVLVTSLAAYVPMSPSANGTAS